MGGESAGSLAPEDQRSILSQCTLLRDSVFGGSGTPGLTCWEKAGPNLVFYLHSDPTGIAGAPSWDDEEKRWRASFPPGLMAWVEDLRRVNHPHRIGKKACIVETLGGCGPVGVLNHQRGCLCVCLHGSVKAGFGSANFEMRVGHLQLVESDGAPGDWCVSGSPGGLCLLLGPVEFGHGSDPGIKVPPPVTLAMAGLDALAIAAFRAQAP